MDESIVLDALPAFPRPLEPTAAFGDRALLLCWHSFLGNPSMDTDFSLHELATQLDSLFALGYRFVDLRDLLAGRISGRLNIVATLDDGHRTVPRAVEEVFLPRGIRPAVFVYPAIIGSVPYAMDEAAVRRLVAEGCLVGAHGYHHLFVTEKLYKSDRAEFNAEIYKAKYKTEALTGLPIMLYAYPYGAYSPVTLSEVEKAGYAYGVAVKKGFVYADSALDPAYELPRLVVTREGWKDIYELLVRNASKGQ
jgi:peptidoglycan/xylan/chitin deacetylase (PgdA/CDA1 family)